MQHLLPREFGRTGLQVSALGFGAGHIGDPNISERDVERLLHTALDAGITLIDTARGYGVSEERIGNHLSRRRSDFILSTKIGYGIPGFEDWTADCIRAGVDTALQLMKTDYLDIVHLHSCPLETLQQDDIIEVLETAVQAGKVRVAAYSGENEALDYAIRTGRFGSLQTSVNFCDQRGIDTLLADASERGMGVIAKRPLANAPWRFVERPVGHYCEEYWVRLQKMGLDSMGYEWDELALRFTAFLPSVHSCIVGTGSLAHLQHNIDILQKGALPEVIVAKMRATFQQADDNWIGQI